MTLTAATVRPFFRDALRPTEVIAHRGGGGDWPEETLFAFGEAERAGVDVLEMDVHATADGHLVLMHDSTVDRTTNGSGKITDLTLRQIKALDAGFRWAGPAGDFPHRGRGLTVPTLREVFEGFPHMRMNVEIKQKAPPVVRPFGDLIREFGMTEKVLVASFWESAMDEFRAAYPEVATSASTPEALKFLLEHNLNPSYRPPTDAIQVRSELALLHLVSRDLVEDAHRLDLGVHAWTVNEEAEMRRLISLGVDGIITDVPTRLLALPDLPPRRWARD